MKFYKVICGDVRDHFSGYTTIKNELLTEKERNRKFRYLHDSVFEEVEINHNKTFWSFGARFEMEADKKRFEVVCIDDQRRFIFQTETAEEAMQKMLYTLNLSHMDRAATIKQTGSGKHLCMDHGGKTYAIAI